jgi:IS30 family transposase
MLYYNKIKAPNVSVTVESTITRDGEAVTGGTVEYGDVLNYTVTIKNTGDADGSVLLKDIVTGKLEDITVADEYKALFETSGLTIVVKPNETITITFSGTVKTGVNEKVKNDISYSVNGGETTTITGTEYDTQKTISFVEKVETIQGTNIVIVLDESGSMDGNKFATAKSATNSFIDQVFPSANNNSNGSTVAVVTFGTQEVCLKYGSVLTFICVESEHQAYAGWSLFQLLLWLNMNTYGQVKKAERLEIAILLSKNYSDAEIAHALGRHRSTVYRERTKNMVKGQYHPIKANAKAYTRRKYAKYQAMRIVKDMKLRQYIETKLLVEHWSPEQIAGRLASESGLQPVSAPTIYKYIRSPYGRQLEYELDLVKKKRQKSKQKWQHKVTALENRVFIDQRPASINNRSRFGHWEADFIVGGKQYGNGSLLVLHERLSRYTLIAKLEARTVREVEDVLIEALPIIGNFESLTLDNDIAFRQHLKLSQLIKAPIYFCQPYHSWEKGGVENANKLIRQYVPKGCDISNYTQQQIWQIQHLINGKPRKILGYKTAKEVFETYQKEALHA